MDRPSNYEDRHPQDQATDCDCTADCEGRPDCPSKTQQTDEGTIFITRERDGDVIIKVRSPGAHSYSFVNLTWQEWCELRSLSPPYDQDEPSF